MDIIVLLHSPVVRPDVEYCIEHLESPFRKEIKKHFLTSISKPPIRKDIKKHAQRISDQDDSMNKTFHTNLF